MNGLTRRDFLGASAAGLAVLLAGCGGSSSSANSGPWTFTDDRGVKVSLKSQPKRIVAYDIAAAGLMNLGLNCVGIFASYPLNQNPTLSGLDLTGVATISSTYGDLDLELLASVRPDLIVTIYDPRLSGPLIGFPDTATQAKVQQLAPIVAINSVKDITPVINRFEQLAQALGVDLGGSVVKNAHQAFATASKNVQTATKNNPGIKVIAIAAFQGKGIAFTRPDQHPTFRLYSQLGVDFVPITSTPGDENTNYNAFFYEFDSFELAGKYPADIILYSDLPGAETPSQLASVPTWAALPAVKAGQLLPWRVLDPFSDKVLAQDLNAIAQAITKAHVVT